MRSVTMSCMPVRFKICCIASRDEAALAISYGASALGFVSAMPSGPGPIDESLIAELTPHMPPGVATFLLTSAVDTAHVIEQQRRCRPNTLQLVDQLERGTHADLRSALPGIGIVQVIHVVDDASLEEAFEAAPAVNALLLDSGNPKLAVKELGGTGRVHDWTLSRRIVRESGVPVYLAGGLRADNVAEAIAQVEPFGVDVCSGVRADGRLDERKLEAFVRAVASA